MSYYTSKVQDHTEVKYKSKYQARKSYYQPIQQQHHQQQQYIQQQPSYTSHRAQRINTYSQEQDYYRLKDYNMSNTNSYNDSISTQSSESDKESPSKHKNYKGNHTNSYISNKYYDNSNASFNPNTQYQSNNSKCTYHKSNKSQQNQQYYAEYEVDVRDDEEHYQQQKIAVMINGQLIQGRLLGLEEKEFRFASGATLEAPHSNELQIPDFTN